MVDLAALCDDLAREHAELDAVVAAVTDAEWDMATPAEGWTIRDQVAHLAFFDEQATLAVRDPDAFKTGLSHAARDVDDFMEGPLRRAREWSPQQVLGWWRTARSEMLDAFATMDASERVPWFGPPMSPASFISARLMETWAHGQDVVDALGIERAPSDRLRHVAHLGVRALPNSFLANGREVPTTPVRVELLGPDSQRWVWNEDATESVTGDAMDFCLVVTQRRHPDDTGLVVSGDVAEEWIALAQAFAGPPGTGRRPGQFARTQ
ncbi:MAG TPA: TIGR03084 family metal-binding protein [Actinomycetota bacterium]|nr:TIGR03084 family metal-binding protein [Actinomycetota bacterium]